MVSQQEHKLERENVKVGEVGNTWGSVWKKKVTKRKANPKEEQSWCHGRDQARGDCDSTIGEISQEIDEGTTFTRGRGLMRNQSMGATS